MASTNGSVYISQKLITGYSSVKVMSPKKVRAICLAALMIMMTSSQMSMEIKQVNDEVEVLQIDPGENIHYVPNSNPMSSIQDAVQFSGQIDSTISGYNDFDYSGDYSDQWNESIATGVGGGDGNHWWKTPTIGSQFTVNISMDDLPHHPNASNLSFALLYGASLKMKVVTNSGSCGERAVSYNSNISSLTCDTPESGGMAYIRISVLWAEDMVEVQFNYTLEVAEHTPATEIEHFCDADWTYPEMCDSNHVLNNRVPLIEGATTSGTIEGWWGGFSSYYDEEDFVVITDGLPNVQRMNMTTVRTDEGPFLQIDGDSDLIDCHSDSSQLSSLTYTEYLDCLIVGPNPTIIIDSDINHWNNERHMLNWSVSYTLADILPIEDPIEGDISGGKAKMISPSTTHLGSISDYSNGDGSWGEYCCDEWGNTFWGNGRIDSRDTYDLSLKHGYGVDFQISSDADIEIEIPSDESCNQGSVNVIQIQAGMPLTLTCTSDSSYDYFRVALHTTNTTNGTARYTITYFVQIHQTNTGINSTADDIGTGVDAPATNEWGSGYENSLVVPLGTSTGGFTHATDLRDSFKIETPPNEGRLVFIKADEMSISGGWSESGDLRYKIIENTGDETMTSHFQITPNDDQSWIRESLISFSPDMYVQQEYTISVHDIEIDSISLNEHIQSYNPTYLAGGERISIPVYQSDNNLSDWNLDSVLSESSMSINLQFDPSKTLRISASQASGQPISLSAYNPERGMSEFSQNETNLSNYFEGDAYRNYPNDNGYYMQDSRWSQIAFSGIDGSSLNITTDYIEGFISSSTRESDTWMAAPGALSGRLGINSDEGVDTTDSWTITIQEDRYYEITLETDEGLQANTGGNDVTSGCWSGSDNSWNGEGSEFESMNITVGVWRIGGSGGYTLRFKQGPVGDCEYNNLGFSGWNSRTGSPGEDIFLSIQNQPWMIPSYNQLELVDSSGQSTGSMQIQNIDNASTSMRNIRATIPSGIEEGYYQLRLTYNGLIVDTAVLYITHYGQLSASSISSYLGPDQSPSWLVDLNSYGEGTPGEWEFSLGETWMRDIDGTPVNIDSVQLTTPTSDVGPSIVGTELPWQPRPGAKIWQTCGISSTVGSDVQIAEETGFSRQWTVSTIDLWLGAPIGTSSSQNSYIDDEIGDVREFTTSSTNPSNDIFYTIHANANAIPIEGVSGVANLYSTENTFVRQSQQFETNEWGQASIMFDYSGLPSGTYSVALDVDDEWEEWMSDIREVSVFAIDSNWNEFTSGGDSNIVEVDFNLTANIRRSTLIAGEDIEVDWSIDSVQQLSELSWELYDSRGRVIATDSILESGTSGSLTITIPESLEAPLYSILYVNARGEHGSSDSVSFTINNIAENMNLIVNVQPDLARPGDTLIVDLELDSDIDYIYWVWGLTENGNQIADGNGWDAANNARFEIELERRNLQGLQLYVNVIDGMGRQYFDMQSIELRDLVELSVQSAFIINAGDTLPLNWEVVSPSLTESDKASKVAVSLVNVGTGEEAYEKSQLINGFKGEFNLKVPSDIRPGTYLMTVSVETADGRSLSSESVINIDEPRDKNMIMGVEFPPWSSMFNWFAILFLIGNLIAIWSVLYRKRTGKDSTSSLLPLTDEDEDEDEDDYFDSNHNQLFNDISNNFSPTGGPLTPNVSQMGAIHDDGYEWLMHPAGSDCWWYRQQPGTEWIRH